MLKGFKLWGWGADPPCSFWSRVQGGYSGPPGVWLCFLLVALFSSSPSSSPPCLLLPSSLGFFSYPSVSPPCSHFSLIARNILGKERRWKATRFPKSVLVSVARRRSGAEAVGDLTRLNQSAGLVLVSSSSQKVLVVVGLICRPKYLGGPCSRRLDDRKKLGDSVFVLD